MHVSELNAQYIQGHCCGAVFINNHPKPAFPTRFASRSWIWIRFRILRFLGEIIYTVFNTNNFHFFGPDLVTRQIHTDPGPATDPQRYSLYILNSPVWSLPDLNVDLSVGGGSASGCATARRRIGRRIKEDERTRRPLHRRCSIERRQGGGAARRPLLVV